METNQCKQGFLLLQNKRMIKQLEKSISESDKNHLLLLERNKVFSFDLIPNFLIEVIERFKVGYNSFNSKSIWRVNDIIDQAVDWHTDRSTNWDWCDHAISITLNKDYNGALLEYRDHHLDCDRYLRAFLHSWEEEHRVSPCEGGRRIALHMFFGKSNEEN